jgi:pimeloyl-ACP methyl ester carboxylesterase
MDTTTKPTLIFVHGAFSTPLAFNYFKHHFRDHPQLSFTYDWNTPTHKVGQDLYQFVVDCSSTQSVILCGHSLGGNVALHSLPHFDQTTRVDMQHVFTYGSPFGGSHHAALIRLFSPQPVFTHIRPLSADIVKLPEITRNRSNITSFITTRGPTSNTSDGVVTVASQMRLTTPQYIEVATNHMEVLMSDAVVDQMRQIINTN